MGIVERFLAQGRRVRGATLYEKGHRTDLDIYSAGKNITRYNFGLMLEQTETEKLLYARLQGLGGELEWGTELTGLEQREDGVSATLVRNGRPETVHARYLVAADGASSTVRKRVGVPFTGNTTEQRFMVMDAAVAGDIDGKTMAININAHGDIALFPLTTDGRYRVISTLPPGFKDEDPTVEDFQAFVKDHFPGGLTLRDPEWFSPYHVHSRSVESMKVGRVFFIGDAAHVHTPVGGQGMNTGLQDAHNLAWKLALVTKGTLAEETLETYHRERYAVAQRLINTSDRVFQAVSEDTNVARFLRTHVFARLVRFATRLPGAKERFFPVIGMTNIRYSDGLVVQDKAKGLPRDAPNVGARWPYVRFRCGEDELSGYSLLDYEHHHLFVFTTELPEELRAEARGLEHAFALKVHLVTPNAQPNTLHCDARTFASFTRKAAAYLVRPDAYVALRGRLEGNSLRDLLKPYSLTSNISNKP